MAYSDKMTFTKDEYIEIKKLWLKTRKKQKKNQEKRFGCIHSLLLKNTKLKRLIFQLPDYLKMK